MTDIECALMRAAYDDGQSAGEIGDDYDWHTDTVRTHIYGRCGHPMEDRR